MTTTYHRCYEFMTGNRRQLNAPSVPRCDTKASSFPEYRTTRTPRAEAFAASSVKKTIGLIGISLYPYDIHFLLTRDLEYES